MKLDAKKAKTKGSIIFVILLGLVVSLFFSLKMRSNNERLNLESYDSNLPGALAYIEKEFDEPEINELFVRYAKGLDRVLESPILSQDEIEKTLNAETDRDIAIACLVLRLGEKFSKHRENIESLLINNKKNFQRYQVYERQFYGKTISANQSVIYFERDCINE
ncbi:MAG: hypothetical protein HRT44_08560 [Bdellovibrionales bacterium]|nr:hypothetical protein [Bdellovibrionales bacterium]NQZ19292.1 hypothetical protein [Bdellovibrionales bacterium]